MLYDITTNKDDMLYAMATRLSLGFYLLHKENSRVFIRRILCSPVMLHIFSPGTRILNENPEIGGP